MLTVVTFTRSYSSPFLDRCKESVAAALPTDAKHQIVICPNSRFFEEMRLEAAMTSELVAFVDDDDTISPDSIKTSLLALESSGAGLSVTNEVMVDESGVWYPDQYHNRKVRRYSDMVIHPRGVHHLCIFNRRFIDVDNIKRISDMFKMGIDWTIKSSAALTGNAIHVPIDGYFWTKRKDQLTSNPQHHQQYKTILPSLGDEIRRTWSYPSGTIPQYIP